MTLAKPVRRAALYATAQETVSAWINGTQVLTADPFPAWQQMPWAKFVRAEVTGNVSAGANTIAIESVYYVATPNGASRGDAPPMIATLICRVRGWNHGGVCQRDGVEDCGPSLQARGQGLAAEGLRRLGMEECGGLEAEA